MKDVLKKLENDEHYYGEFGKQYLSNSDISTLLTNPLALGKQQAPRPAFLVGGYFHTAILEPDKLSKYKIVDATTRNTKAYKEISGGELCLLQHEVDQIELMTEKVLANDVCKDLIRGINVDYEKPGITELEGLNWKGKADIVNHDEKLIIDLKTTADLNKFKWSASKYNYDSQAYIYSKLFGYEFVFIVIDKTTHQLGIFDCSPEFYERGKDKVQRAAEQYKLFYQSEDFDPQQFLLIKHYNNGKKKTVTPRTKVCTVTGLETSLDNFYKNQNHVKAVDNLRRNSGATKSQLQRMFNQLNAYV